MKISKKSFIRKKKIINGWIHIDSVSAFKIMAKNKFDAITIDLQHGMFNFEICRDFLQIISKYAIMPIVRVPSNDIGIINKVIDAGAFGVICPLINNRIDLDKFTNACFYPPKGIRSFGPTLVNIDNQNYFEKSNNEILAISMIETKESVENLDDILKNKNLDMIYVGPWDLSISYGFKPDKVFKEKKMIHFYEHILNKAKKYKKKSAIHCSGSDTASFFLKMGFDMVTISTDLNLLNKALVEELNNIK